MEKKGCVGSHSIERCKKRVDGRCDSSGEETDLSKLILPMAKSSITGGSKNRAMEMFRVAAHVG